MRRSLPISALLLLVAAVAAGCSGGSKAVTPVVGPTGGPTAKPTTGPTAAPTATPTSQPLTGALLVLDLTKTNLPAGTPVYAYIIGTVKGSSVSYWLKPLTSATVGTNVNQPLALATMNPGSQIPPSGCANNGDDTNFWSCNQNQIPAALASAINGSSGTNGNYPNAWADYSIPATVGTTLTMNLSALSSVPGLGTGLAAFSGRVFVSVGTPKLPITPVAGGGYVSPAYGNISGQPGQWTLYDWIEFSYDSLGVFNGNTTQVNEFGLPLQLSGTGVSAPQVLTQSRSAILNSLATAPYGVVSPPAGAAAAYPAGTTYLRAIAPQTIVTAGTYPSNGALRSTFDAAIGAGYTAWQSTPLVTHDQGTGDYTGVVFPTSPSIPPPAGYPTGSLAFYAGRFPTMQALATAVASGLVPSFYLTGSTGANPNVIASADIWANQAELALPGKAEGNVGKMIAAAFSRGVMVSPAGVVTTLLDDTPGACQPATSTFYPSGGTFNWWAQYFHSISSPSGLAYGFSYDDVCSQNPSISFTPGTVTITVGTF